MASTPSSCGITRSISTTSGRSRSASSTAWRPSAASPTTSIPSWRSRNVRSPSRTTAWSSAISTRMTSASGHLEAHSRSRARSRVDREPPAQAARPLLHRRQPEAAGAELGLAGVEPVAVVVDLQNYAAVASAEPYVHVLRVGVPDRVVERFLGDPEYLGVA